MEILLSDSATKLPLTGAVLKADKYYFKDMASFNKASSFNDADEIVKNVAVSGVFGDAGHYMVRQVQAPGIYGYHVYGTIDYFKVAHIPVNATIFCKAADGDTSKFNSPGWAGGFGCTDDINDIAFPKDAISGKNDNGQGNDHKAAIKIAAIDANGQALHVYAKIQQGGKILKGGLTPLTFNSGIGQTYQISIANFGDKQFARWEDGSTVQRGGRTITLSSGATFTAKFATTNVKTSFDSSSKAQMTIPVTYGYAASGQSDAVAGADTIAKSSMSLAHLSAIGIPVAAAAGVFG